MCGIVGMAGDINNSHKDVFKDLLTICQLRGRDATGAFRIDNTGDWHAVKRVGLPDMLIDTKAYDREIGSGFAKVMVGHCRAKTAGANTNQNAHPFEHQHIIGVHNGTLRSSYEMEGWKDFDVDSDMLYWHIAKYGVEEVVPKLDSNGAWALVWWDSNDKTLNFLRNQERPLWFCHSEDKKVMYWASEPWWFAAIERRGMKLWDGGEEQGKVYQLPTNQLYSFEVNGNGKTPQDIFNMKPVIELKAKEVRSNLGNVHGRTGAVPTVRGGEVTRPFQRENLDDTVIDIGPHLGGHRPAALRQLLLEKQRAKAETANTQTPVESSPIGGSIDNATNGTPKGTVCTTGLSGSQNSARARLSLQSRLSSPLQQENNGVTCTSYEKSLKTSNQGRTLTDLREIGGISYITDRKTGREFTEMVIDEHTGSKCCFCNEPIGGLEEINELFVRDTGTNAQKNHVSFICKPCVNPARKYN